jgi:hypothetical protein
MPGGRWDLQGPVAFAREDFAGGMASTLKASLCDPAGAGLDAIEPRPARTNLLGQVIASPVEDPVFPRVAPTCSRLTDSGRKLNGEPMQRVSYPETLDLAPVDVGRPHHPDEAGGAQNPDRGMPLGPRAGESPGDPQALSHNPLLF